MYTEDEFADFVTIKGQRRVVTPGAIRTKYNYDRYNPRDGRLIKACDNLAAFVEAYIALRNGSTAEELQEAKHNIKNEHRDEVVSGIAFGPIYADFE